MDEEKKNSVNSNARMTDEKFQEFIETAAHDLQSPLRKLSVLIERVFTRNENSFDDNGREYIHRIESCIREMRSLIDGLSELARTDRTVSTLEECDLNAIIGEILESLREEISNESVVVSIHPLPTLFGNRFQYKQLFTNLFDNAVKFRQKNMPARIEVTTSTSTGEEKSMFGLPVDKKYFTVELHDNGLGFDRVNAEKIFEPFVRLHPKSEYEGNGLGLFICKKIVVQHHGVIYAAPHEKEGARFVLFLPETPWP